MDLWVLITTIDRNILTETFRSEAAAWSQMINEICMAGKIPKEEVEGCMVYEDAARGVGFGVDGGYCNNGLYGNDYDWRIIHVG